MQCSFCADVTRTGELLYEDSLCWIVLHSDHAVEGHAMIVAKRHVENVSDLPEEEWHHLARVWHRVERLLLEATGMRRSVILKLGIQTPHLHIHLYPVAGDATRDEVFAAIDGKTCNAPREAFVADLRRRLADDNSSRGA
jgi:diadenosine tetraphosphate (Ap4A) HIT family hydrolase